MRNIFPLLALISFNSFAIESNPFQDFDNNFTAGITGVSSPGNYWATTLGANGQALLDNGIWINLLANTKLSLSLDNNSSSNISQTYNNAAASNYGAEIGYAFLISNNYQVIPHGGLSYSNQLLSINQNSIQEFVIEDPAIHVSAGVKNELIVIAKKLKLGMDLNFNYGFHQAVVPNSNDGSLAHYNYGLYTISATPSIQWNFSEKFTMLGFYQYSYNFGNNTVAPNASYSSLNVNTSDYLLTNFSQNTVGLSFGVRF